MCDVVCGRVVGDKKSITIQRNVAPPSPFHVSHHVSHHLVVIHVGQMAQCKDKRDLQWNIMWVVLDSTTTSSPSA